MLFSLHHDVSFLCGVAVNVLWEMGMYVSSFFCLLLCIVDESIDGKLFHLRVYMRYLGGYKKNRAAFGICSVECW